MARRIHFDITSVNRDEWIRLAAFIDGEGSINITKKWTKGRDPRHLGLQMSVSNTDIRLMYWLKKNFGGCVVSLGTPKKGQKPAFSWNVKTQHAQSLIEGIFPFLLLKREQADIALKFRSTFKFGRNQQEPLTEADHNQRESLRLEMNRLNQRGVPVQ